MLINVRIDQGKRLSRSQGYFTSLVDWQQDIPASEGSRLIWLGGGEQVKGQLKKLKGKGVVKETDKRRRRLVAKLAAQRDRIAEARATLDEALSSGWRTFESLRDVLVSAGILLSLPFPHLSHLTQSPYNFSSPYQTSTI